MASRWQKMVSLRQSPRRPRPTVRQGWIGESNEHRVVRGRREDNRHKSGYRWSDRAGTSRRKGSALLPLRGPVWEDDGGRAGSELLLPGMPHGVRAADGERAGSILQTVCRGGITGG